MFGKIAILGTGLLGASFMQAVRQRGLATQIAAWSRRAETRAFCAGKPWCDSIHETLPECVRSAELVVACVPVDKIGATLAEAAPGLGNGALVTDVGSVKAAVCRSATAAVAGTGAVFLGSHPMAGSEKSGPEHATPELFDGGICFVTPQGGTAPEPVAVLTQLWEKLGMRVVRAAPEEHDAIVARVSHLPHFVAASLSATLQRHPAAWRGFGGPGLRDTTRVSAGDPALWRAIAAENREAILRALTEFEAELAVFKKAIETGDFARLDSELRRAQEWRGAL